MTRLTKAIKERLRSKGYFYALILGYSIGIAIVYTSVIGFKETEWYSFYSFLDTHKAIPYVDIREGYPPLGFLVYIPLYFIFQGNVTAFLCGFRVLNGTLLVVTLGVLFYILRSKFDDKDAAKRTLYYGILPSIVIANTYSNNIVALLPAALAIYMMTQKKPLKCGVLLGIATLGKGFPILLLIPALITFEETKDRLKLVGITFTVLLVASLPFMLANPLTYLSTFTHHGSRGPWETLWAFIDGYYSHGGLLHPYFDKFFYQSNFLKIYQPNPYDHAIYEWKFNLLPTLLTVSQIAIILLFSSIHLKRKNRLLSLCGLIYISYIFFFKGYSTQFTVSTSFYMLLATLTQPLLFLIPLEVSHILQMLSWEGQMVASEIIRNWHLPLLVSAVIIRSIIFASLILSRVERPHIKPITNGIRQFIAKLNSLKDKKTVTLIAATVLMIAISGSIFYNYSRNNSIFRSFEGDLNLTQTEWKNINLEDLEKGDQVMVRLNTNLWVEAEAVFDDTQVEMERSVVNPYHLKGSFNKSLLYFDADSESGKLKLKTAHPAMPFRVTNGLEADLDINATSDDPSLVFNLQDKGRNGHSSMFRIAYPFKAYVNEGFSLSLKYEVIEGNVSDVLLDVFDDTDEWIYTFATTEDFILEPDSKDVCGCSNLSNDQLSLVAIIVLIDDNSSATIKLEELKINSNNETQEVGFYAENQEQIQYEIFIERDLPPPTSYRIALVLTVALGAATAYHLYKN